MSLSAAAAAVVDESLVMSCDAEGASLRKRKDCSVVVMVVALMVAFMVTLVGALVVVALVVVALVGLTKNDLTAVELLGIKTFAAATGK